MEPVFSFHLIIFDYNRSSIEIDHQSKPPDRLFSMIDYEISNNLTTLALTPKAA